MIREIVIPTENNYTIFLPDEFIGKKVEVIAFELEEKEIMPSKKTVEQLKKELQGLTVNMQGFKFNRDEANDYD